MLEKLKKLNNKLKILAALTTIGVGALNSNVNTYAMDNNYKIEAEEDMTTSNKYLNPKTMDEYIEYFSNVYGIKEELIYDRLDYMFNENTENEEFMDMNLGLKVLTVTRDIYKDNNISDEIKKTGKTYEVNLTPEELTAFYEPIIGVNKEVALSIEYTECGNDMASSNFLNNNNPAGMGPNNHYENKEIGIITFMFMLKGSPYNCTLDSGIEFFPSVASTYCELPDHWISLCTGHYNDICEDYYFKHPEVRKKANYFGKEDEEKNKETSSLTKTNKPC